MTMGAVTVVTNTGETAEFVEKDTAGILQMPQPQTTRQAVVAASILVEALPIAAWINQVLPRKTATTELRAAAEDRLARPEVKADALWLADQIDALALDQPRNLFCTWSDDGELIAEWMFHGRRIAFSFDPDGPASWFYVDIRPGHRTQQSGELRSAQLRSLLSAAFME